MNTNQPYDSPQVIFPKREPSWFSRNAIWFIPLMIFLIVVPILCGGVLFFFAKTAMHLVHGPRDAAVQAMMSNDRVVAVMGEPIDGAEFVTIRDMQINNDDGSMEIGFEAAGPNSKADVDGVMLLVDGEWEVGFITIKFPDGNTIEMGDPVHHRTDDGDSDEAEDGDENGLPEATGIETGEHVGSQQ